jgi:protein-S-isoprenylcysteine O-methyltransferase Ste14
LPLEVLGCVLLVGSVVAGTWAVAKMGWARLLFAGALFPTGAGAEENRVPQRLVIEGPYRYVRNPLYDTDLCLILGTGLLTRRWALVLLAALYLAQLALQLPLEERELRERFGIPYRRYFELVPRFIPRRRPVRQRDLYT